MNNSSKKTALAIVSDLKAKGFQAFFVGGFVRDMLLKRESDNIDIASSATPDQIESTLRALSLKPLPHGKKYGTILTIADGLPIEITTLRKEGFYSDRRHPDKVVFVNDYQEDAKRRDLTINAIYYDPLEKKILDPEGGQKDLKANMIRFVGKATKRIDEDALRMIRAIRFATQFGYKLERNSYAAIKTRAKYIQGVSGERLKTEFDKILVSKNREAGIRLLEETGLLKFLIKDIEKSKKITHDSKKYHLEGDVFNHTMISLRHSDDINVLYAMLFHDLGKIYTQIRQMNNGEMVFRYFGHQVKSAAMFRVFAKRLRFSRLQSNLIEWLILHHDDRLNFKNMKLEKQIAYLRHKHIQPLLEVWRADSLANIRILDDGTKGSRLSPTYEDAIKKLKRLAAVEPLITKLADGDTIMKYTKLKPGPAVKKAIDKLATAIYERKIHNLLDLKTFLRNKTT